VELLQEDERERGVASWAASFEKLLEDSAGLHTFAVSGKAISIYLGQVLYICHDNLNSHATKLQNLV
jgi:hypothetical protein